MNVIDQATLLRACHADEPVAALLRDGLVARGRPIAGGDQFFHLSGRPDRRIAWDDVISVRIGRAAWPESSKGPALMPDGGTGGNAS